MRNWQGSSQGSAPCRLEWRPSRWLALAQAVLGLLAALAWLATDAPTAVAVPAAGVALAWGLASARRVLRMPAQKLVLATCAQGMSMLGPAVLAAVRVQWRGPLAFVTCTLGDGTRVRLVFWPDTLPPPARRELRLAAGRPAASPAAAGMAP